MSEDLRPALQAFASRFPYRTICGADGSLYLTRWKLRDLPGGGSMYLHRFSRGDEDRELHNHPWSGRSVILVGGYSEERRDGDRVVEHIYMPGDTSIIEPDTFHRVDLIEEDCWSLFSVGPRVQEWGFWDRDTGAVTPWREFVAGRGSAP